LQPRNMQVKYEVATDAHRKTNARYRVQRRAHGSQPSLQMMCNVPALVSTRCQCADPAMPVVDGQCSPPSVLKEIAHVVRRLDVGEPRQADQSGVDAQAVSGNDVTGKRCIVSKIGLIIELLA